MRKALLLSILSVSFFYVYSGCSSVGTAVSEETGRPEDSVSDDLNYYRSLADYLKHVPGVNISRNGVVTIRGISNLQGVSTPLFVIDGIAIGHSYSEANNMVDPLQIDFVKVLKGPDAAIYGVRGGNGVIEIVTKKS